MKKHCLLSTIIFILFFLVSCSSYRTTSQVQVSHNLLKETWMQKINTDPYRWIKTTDPWFINGEPNKIERYAQTAPFSQAISITMVRVPDFNNIQVDGKFQVQIMGYQEHNTVYVVGPNEQTRQTIVEIKGRTLCIRQANSKVLTNRVIVRIGINNLCKLTSNGPCLIAGRDIRSNNLVIDSNGNGDIMLNGNINLAQVNQRGAGTITVLGVYSPSLNLNVKGNGNVRVSGRVGVRSINHTGSGVVEVIGADSDGLSIFSAGSGKTSVVGYVNLKKVTACNSSCVYVYWVNSNGLYVNQSEASIVGLAGATANLNLDMTNASRFYGQYLHGGNIYVRTANVSHANVNPDKKMFAAAFDKSSIYFFGSPNIVSRYTSGQGIVMPVWNNNEALPAVRLPQPSFTGPSTVKTYPYKMRKSFKE